MGAVTLIYRVRGPILFIAVPACLAGAVRRFLPDGILYSIFAFFPLLGIVGILAVLAATPLAVKRLTEQESITVTSPVTGRWLGMNSPVDKVPSHGVRAYGQAHAIDLVYEPLDQERPVFGTGPAMRGAGEYPAFGQPVRAMVDGVVVRASDVLRDHRARSAWLGVIYMMVEGAVRELGGPRFIIGNHVTIRGDDGIYALVAHIEKGSVLVAEGDRVSAGQVIAACGNSGNTSEPHVHAQLMDRASAWTGQGVPFAFAGVKIGELEELQDALPGNNQHMTVGSPVPRQAKAEKVSEE
ncbi:metalloendopeptidase-like membrane protein [Arthrobacter sp. PAMC 25486]|uniref:M23 family metallopeptidase n=1 Tax=Arthrobacter sp. PAMC 25486 TaxID=1494608 RepID=UPI00053611EC|nr:M23 family metallopeptidase [Arthrobacter sp. PAMC 25486]AIY02500.1 metalloendopeptidase-like membrane protein [Arthrobacter sp. PAMC 25486]